MRPRRGANFQKCRLSALSRHFVSSVITFFASRSNGWRYAAVSLSSFQAQHNDLSSVGSDAKLQASRLLTRTASLSTRRGRARNPSDHIPRLSNDPRLSLQAGRSLDQHRYLCFFPEWGRDCTPLAMEDSNNGPKLDVAGSIDSTPSIANRNIFFSGYLVSPAKRAARR